MTFVAQELVGLEQEGIGLWIATWGEPDKIRHALHGELKAPVHRLPNPPLRRPRLLTAWLKVRQWQGYSKARDLLQEDLVNASSKKRQRRMFQRATILAAELPSDIAMIYAHFIGSTATVARYAALIRGIPFAASAHARDIWTARDWDKKTKLASMDWLTTCTTDGAEHLKTLADRPEKVHLVHHGLSFERFPEPPAERSPNDGSVSSRSVQILSVGRAVEKKGFDVLLDAFAKLPTGLHWKWHHVGAGPISDTLRQRANTLGLSHRINWHGAQDQAAVIELYRSADLFVLPSREAADGDRDGLPNVLMEAQSQGLACLSTRFSEIPELIRDGETGVLVAPGDVQALAKALHRLIQDPAERRRLGLAGCQRVRSEFRAEHGISQIAALLRQSMA